jgi:hypothetical protein
VSGAEAAPLTVAAAVGQEVGYMWPIPAAPE